MRAVSLKSLKNKLSKYVRLAARGETVLVTDRDRVVAELVPPRAGRNLILTDATLAEAMRQGWVTPPVMAGSVPPRKPIMPFRKLMAELQRDRDERCFYQPLRVVTLAIVMAGLFPAIHVFDLARESRRGCPAQGRA